MASRLAIMRQGKLIAFETPDGIVQQARGRIWAAQVGNDNYDALRARVHVLHAQCQGGVVNVRIAHPHQPCDGAQPAEPSLEEALMEQRYALNQTPGLAA